MLEKNDLSAIREMMEEVVDKTVDEKIGKAVTIAVEAAVGPAVEAAVGPAVEAAVGPAVDAAIKPAVESAIEKNNVLIFAEMSKLETRMGKKIESAIEENNVILFDEMERYYKMNHRDIVALTKKVDEIETYYRIKKLEDNTISILLKTTQELRDDVDDIKTTLRKMGKFDKKIDGKLLTSV